MDKNNEIYKETGDCCDNAEIKDCVTVDTEDITCNDKPVYYYCFKKELVKDIDALCIVPAKHWNSEHTRCKEYVLSDDDARKLEEIGLFESMQCVFEYRASAVKKTDIKKVLGEIGVFKTCKKFEEYMNSDIVGLELLGKKTISVDDCTSIREVDDFNELLKEMIKKREARKKSLAYLSKEELKENKSRDARNNKSGRHSDNKRSSRKR